MERLYMAAKSISNDVRRKSASGGIFFELAKLVLDENGIVYGAAFTESWEVQHIRVSKEEELPKLQGSKYSQSTIVTVFADIKKDLNEGRMVLFCGTPCQANAVLAYVGYSNRDKLLLCDIVCHGVTNSQLFKDLIELLEKKHGRIVEFKFRNKETGWKKQKWSAVFYTGKECIETEEINAFHNLYSKNLIQRPSCYKCPFTTVDKKTDLTLGDFWGIERLNSNIEDTLGVSLIIIHSDKGLKYINKLNDKIITIECSKEQCLQPQLISPTVKPTDYDEFWNEYVRCDQFITVLKKYGYPPVMRRIKNRIKHIISKED